jgi:hypothetical protein
MTVAYTFEFIADERKNETSETLIEMDQRLWSAISQFGIYVTLKDITGIREFWYPDNQKQWRKEYIVIKNSRAVTWNEIMGAVNAIYPSHYKRRTL